jgi:hypothetical protein
MAMMTETVTESREKLSCTQALAESYRLALAKLPADTHGRLAKALALVQAGQVFETDHGHWEVASQSEGGYPHSLRVNGACDCDWQHFNPGEFCTHRLAVALQKKTMQLLTQTQPEPEMTAADLLDDETAGDLVDVMPIQEPTMQIDTLQPPPAPLPEALFSATLRGTVGGHETLLTVRGMTAAEFTANLHAVRDLLDAPHASVPHATPQTPTAETPVCQWHGAMKASTKAVGTWYCSSKMGDGSYCKERYPKA